jgi:sugar phosphate permease
MAEHVLDSAGRRPSVGTGAGRLHDRGRPFRSGVCCSRSHWCRGAHHCDRLARYFGGSIEPRAMAGVQARVAEVGRDRLVLVTSGAQAAQFVLNGTLNAFLPLYGREVLGLSVTQLDWRFGLQTPTTLAVRPAIGFFSDRAGRRWVIVTGLVVCSAAVVLVSIATNLSEIITAIVAYAAGVATTTAATSAYITDVTRRARYGAAHGVFGTIYDVGDALGPIVAGFPINDFPQQRCASACPCKPRYVTAVPRGI